MIRNNNALKAKLCSVDVFFLSQIFIFVDMCGSRLCVLGQSFLLPVIYNWGSTPINKIMPIINLMYIFPEFGFNLRNRG